MLNGLEVREVLTSVVHLAVHQQAQFSPITFRGEICSWDLNEVLGNTIFLHSAASWVYYHDTFIRLEMNDVAALVMIDYGR